LNIAHFRFYEELNDFLSKERKKVVIPYQFKNHPAIKDSIEALGIPHTEVDLILVNGKSVKFSYQLNDGDYVSVYPVFEALDITPISRLRPKPLRNPKFIVDVNSGKLARFMRLLGFDVLFTNHYKDAEIAKIAYDKRRIVLTRDVGLLKNNLIKRGYWLRKTNPKDQVKEVLMRFDLVRMIKPFTCCLECNGTIKTVPKENISRLLPDSANRYYTKFYQCRSCKQIYWEGSHFQKMREFIEELVK